eukprot:470758_1
MLIHHYNKENIMEIYNLNTILDQESKPTIIINPKDGYQEQIIQLKHQKIKNKTQNVITDTSFKRKSQCNYLVHDSNSFNVSVITFKKAAQLVAYNENILTNNDIDHSGDSSGNENENPEEKMELDEGIAEYDNNNTINDSDVELETNTIDHNNIELSYKKKFIKKIISLFIKYGIKRM